MTIHMSASIRSLPPRGGKMVRYVSRSNAIACAAAFWILHPAQAQASACFAQSVTNMNFNTYLSSNATSGTSGGSVSCFLFSAWTVGMSIGNGAGATTTNRKLTLTSGGYALNYQLSRDSQNKLNWGNNPPTDTLGGNGTGFPQTFTAYGTIPAGQYVPFGTYQDTVVANINDSGQTTASFTLTATVQKACTISAGSLAFGNYSGSQTDATANLTVTCTFMTPYYVNLDNGQNQDAAYYPRMKGPGLQDLVGYRLYQDANHTIEWRNTYHLDGQSGTGAGASQTLTVYGRVQGGVFSAPGAYTDTVTATLTY